MRAARNSAIGCAILLAVIEGVGIGIQRMMAENTRLDVCWMDSFVTSDVQILTWLSVIGSASATSASIRRHTVADDRLNYLVRHRNFDSKEVSFYTTTFTPLSNQLEAAFDHLACMRSVQNR